ncbi:MAG: hypothetical protein GY797_15800 [Deltaproteobacteria bacterium]|nr:hypothetical protein [Deltaproteobacteria bacterium]
MGNSNDTTFFLVFIPLIVGVFTALGLQAHISRRKKERKQTAVWKKFAQDHNLKFTPGSFFNSDVKISGLYRNYYVELFTSWHQKEGNKTGNYRCTNFYLFTNRRNWNDIKPVELDDHEITEQQIISLLVPNGLVCHLRKNVLISVDEKKIHCRYENFEEDKEYLSKLIDMLCDLENNYSVIVNSGGEFVPTLQTIANNNSHLFRSIAIYLLEGIASKSERLRISKPKLLCPRCFLRYKTQKVKLFGRESPSYYACPKCHQNRDYFLGRVVAVLNNRMKKECREIQNALKVNWCFGRKIFDFDTVEIEQATDEDVERFAVQVGNDTDEVRKSRYKQMICKISPSCELSENTIRILQHTFAHVETMTHTVQKAR